jgi:ABC-type transporter Mla subunit MlaD
MSEFESPGMALESPPKRRSAGARFAEFGDRIARSFASLERPKSPAPVWAPAGHGEAPEDEQSTAQWEELEPQFAIVRHGYDPAAVDEYIAELEQELEQRRSDRPAAQAIAQEIDRIGEQTAAILRVAHDKAAEVTREAQAQADKVLADAASSALAITEGATQRLRELDAETDSIWQERGRLIDDVRNMATALFTLAEDAAERYPDEPAKATQAVDVVEPASAEPAQPPLAPPQN